MKSLEELYKETDVPFYVINIVTGDKCLIDAKSNKMEGEYYGIRYTSDWRTQGLESFSGWQKIYELVCESDK